MASDLNDELFTANQDIFASLGFAISNFAQVEFGLLSLFDTLSGLNEEVSAALFWSIGSTRNQVRSLNELANAVLKNQDLQSTWSCLKRKISEAVDARDRLAHGEVVVLQRTPKIKDVFFGPRFQRHLQRGSGSGPVDWQPHDRLGHQEIIELARQFWVISREIDIFCKQIRKSK